MNFMVQPSPGRCWNILCWLQVDAGWTPAQIPTGNKTHKFTGSGQINGTDCERNAKIIQYNHKWNWKRKLGLRKLTEVIWNGILIFQLIKTRYWGTRFSGHGSDGLMVGLDQLRVVSTVMIWFYDANSLDTAGLKVP